MITDAGWGENGYDYDANGQIKRTRYRDGGAERFAYTPDLNLAATGSDTDRFLNWQTTAASVVRIAHGPRGEVVTLEHDACGRVVRRTVTRKGFRPQTWHFEWNAQDQLVAADGPHGRWRYDYDPFGRRIFKDSNGRREALLWDGDVLARSDDIDWFFEPDSFRPMARRQAGTLFHIVNDHLGTPKEMFSEGGDLVWSVDHDTWGTVRHAGPRQVESGDYWVENVAYEVGDASPAPEALLCPIRFQGQWEDAESGLYYNRFRYYDALVGQYVSPDPIGILGGARAQSYVASTPRFVDVYDLCRFAADDIVALGCNNSGLKGWGGQWEQNLGSTYQMGVRTGVRRWAAIWGATNPIIVNLDGTTRSPIEMAMHGARPQCSAFDWEMENLYSAMKSGSLSAERVIFF